MIRRASSVVACAGLLFGLGACKSQTTAPPAAPETTSATVGPQLTERQLSAGHVFGVLRAIYAAEVEHAMLAVTKASEPRVRAFAEKVVGDGRGRMAQDSELMSRLDITPLDGEISEGIWALSSRQNWKLEAMTGIDFDRAYLDEQIRQDRALLSALERELIPNAGDPQIRASIENARERLNDHLREAQDLRASISSQAP